MGGSDQWGNIVNGVDLVRRVDGRPAFGLTTPLLTTSDGNKMGKTARGAVWMDRDKLSPFEFWQYWRNVADPDIGRFLTMFTEMDLGECRRLGELRDSEANQAKIILAREVTTLAHGADEAARAEKTARDVFQKGAGSEGLPTCLLADADVADEGLAVTRALVLSGLASSGKEARRMVSGGGARLDGIAVTDPAHRITRDDLSAPVKLSSGRKRHAMLSLESSARARP